MGGNSNFSVDKFRLPPVGKEAWQHRSRSPPMLQPRKRKQAPFGKQVAVHVHSHFHHHYHMRGAPAATAAAPIIGETSISEAGESFQVLETGMKAPMPPPTDVGITK